jgi:hypothetical protein
MFPRDILKTIREGGGGEGEEKGRSAYNAPPAHIHVPSRNLNNLIVHILNVLARYVEEATITKAATTAVPYARRGSGGGAGAGLLPVLVSLQILYRICVCGGRKCVSVVGEDQGDVRKHRNAYFELFERANGLDVLRGVFDVWDAEVHTAGGSGGGGYAGVEFDLYFLLEMFFLVIYFDFHLCLPSLPSSSTPLNFFLPSLRRTLPRFLPISFKYLTITLARLYKQCRPSFSDCFFLPFLYQLKNSPSRIDGNISQSRVKDYSGVDPAGVRLDPRYEMVIGRSGGEDGESAPSVLGARWVDVDVVYEARCAWGEVWREGDGEAETWVGL